LAVNRPVTLLQSGAIVARSTARFALPHAFHFTRSSSWAFPALPLRRNVVAGVAGHPLSVDAAPP
jgi:hypothetical protein